ncbi:hypothetical protein BDV37DRAFT_249332 [Aspergillus pseudonomiae]|uniref:Uncharacterized protein n=1 Tax=Aspergillus pseudonomiae TaxID=1506151 RepID=A0A5N7DCR6_9EURO|nr:uncharacterized protein BDV37DRAFT_249332 [Aspergillus pseudonomiae]KAE8403793.1 hypothetical protein BDV37DRAFT_249332 [Aspergillus pseudonomiae]
MANFRGGDRPFSSIQHILKMLLSPHQSNKSAPQENAMAEDIDEPPDHRFLNTSQMNVDDGVVYVKSPTAMSDKKESLLTRALRHSPTISPSEELPSPHDRSFYRSYPHSNVSGVSTAELTSDEGLSSPSLSSTPSPPLPAQLSSKTPSMGSNKKLTIQTSESTVEANLGRKRCISFACGRKTEEPKAQPPTPQRPTAQKNDTNPTPTEPAKRRTVLTFVCPARDPETKRERSPCRGVNIRSRLRGSPAPIARKASPEKVMSPVAQDQKLATEKRGVPTSGLGKFEESEATRFHEFASSEEEDDEWVTKSGDYTDKITMSDCMKKEIAIRKLGEEAEEEALEDEEEGDDDEDEDDDEDDDDSSSDLSSDDGNESDNEAGFADSDESDDGSEYEFWAPASTTAATSPLTLEIPPAVLPRRDSNTSFDSGHDDLSRRWPPALSGKGINRAKPTKMRPRTPHLPDSTDFVCGTFDEDRPLEAAYKSCIEQRRLSKQIIIPQDIDPSFPTSDLDEEDEEDDDDLEESIMVDEPARGRSGADQTRKQSPRLSPKRMVSPPPPRRHGRSSPRRLRSPPPPMKLKSPVQAERIVSDESTHLQPGMNISELVQRRHVTRTKSLPRTPNPFFAKQDGSYRWTGIVPLRESPERESSRTREVHTRGPIDIVEGLEKKRQKRKEKYWRQHCRKAAKEQMVRRPIPGKGAERMKDLGLAVAERCRAYGVGEDAQLVLSV